MKITSRLAALCFIVLIGFTSCSKRSHLSENAQILLDYFYEISGEMTLTGQHNYIGKLSIAHDSLYRLTGKYPAIWGSDFGFSEGGIDDIHARPQLIEEVKRQHKAGSIITLTYHQASPTIGEPCTFKGGVQVKLTDKEWADILTPGTTLYQEWVQQMELFAEALLQIKEAGIPILFRPYHEMNGSWFWWGGRPGENGFPELWRQMYALYTEKYELDNLIWVWSPDDPDHGLEGYYPGDAYVDIVSVDLYHYGKTGPVYDQADYERISAIAPDKPLAVGESSELPTDSILIDQPLWTSFMTWENHIFRRNSPEKIYEVYHSDCFITRDELPDFAYQSFN